MLHLAILKIWLSVCANDKAYTLKRYARWILTTVIVGKVISINFSLHFLFFRVPYLFINFLLLMLYDRRHNIAMYLEMASLLVIAQQLKLVGSVTV